MDKMAGMVFIWHQNDRSSRLRKCVLPGRGWGKLLSNYRWDKLGIKRMDFDVHPLFISGSIFV
jgi:hypothetical protein